MLGLKLFHVSKRCHWPRLVSSSLSCISQNRSLPCMLMTVSNTGCNCFAQCHCGISYMCKTWNWYSYLLKVCDMLKINKNLDKRRRRSKTRQDKTRRGDTQTRRRPMALKNNLKCVDPCVTYGRISTTYAMTLWRTMIWMVNTWLCFCWKNSM